jgi:hypothetical protein
MKPNILLLASSVYAWEEGRSDSVQNGGHDSGPDLSAIGCQLALS